MLRRIGSWTLIVVGGLALALFVATFATTDDKSDWPGFVFFFVIALAVIALGVRGLRGPRRKGPEVEPPSERFTDAYRQLQAGEPSCSTRAVSAGRACCDLRPARRRVRGGDDRRSRT